MNYEKKNKSLFAWGALWCGLILLLGFSATSGFTVAAGPVGGGDPPSMTWNVTFDGGYEDKAIDIATDAAGNSFVFGYSDNGINKDFRLVKYDSNGNVVWNAVLDDGGNEGLYVFSGSVALDTAGNIYISDISYKSTYDELLVAKYNSAGALQWVARYNSGSGDQASGAVPDESGNVYVAGVRYTGQSDSDRYLLKLDSNGVIIWNKTDVHSGRDRDGDIARDASGNLYVTGFLDDAYRTTKYDSNGNVLWDHTYNPGVYDYANDLALDSAGNVYVSGWSSDNVTIEAVTLKYNNSGTLLWDRRYDAGQEAFPAGMAVDGSGAVYVGATKSLSNGTIPVDTRLIKYDSAGTLLWDVAYDSGQADGSGGVAVDAEGNIVLAGYSFNGVNYDLRTIQYSETGTLVSRKIQMGFEIFQPNELAARIQVADPENLVVVPGATVDVTFTLPDGTWITSAVTNSTGWASFRVPTAGGGVCTITVDDVTLEGYLFDPSQSVLTRTVNCP